MTRVGLTKARQIIHDARNKRGALFFEILPGPAFCYASSDMFWHIYCVLFSGTYYHGCGTCRMSDDGKGVVDSCLRVRGVGSLRIADASVFPTIPSGPIAAICMAVGLYAAELLTTKM
jgi:choline dehydrogenase